jgi:hypothetical protein
VHYTHAQAGALAIIFEDLSHPRKSPQNFDYCFIAETLQR